MRLTKCYLILSLLLVFGHQSFAQSQAAIGQWRDHLPYLQNSAVTKGGNNIFCSAKSSIFFVNLNDNSINRITTNNGLSDVDISTIKYNDKSNTLVIAYKNGNIDLRLDNGEIINSSFIKKSDITGSKFISRIDMVDEFAYLSCGFGIVVFDTKRQEIKETYFVGPSGDLSIFDVEVGTDTIYAITKEGMFKGPRLRNLADYRSWIKDTQLPETEYSLIQQLGDKLLANQVGIVNDSTLQVDTLYARTNGTWQKIGALNSSINFDFSVFDNQLLVSQEDFFLVYDTSLDQVDRIFTYNDLAFPRPRKAIKVGNDFWAADDGSGLVKFSDNFHATLYRINSPQTERNFDMQVSGGHFWFAAGGLSANYGSIFFFPIVGELFEGEWANYSRQTDRSLEEAFDMVTVAIDPNNPAHAFAGSFGGGLIEIENGKIKKVYDASNASEHSLSPAMENSEAYYVGGLDFDDASNLWICNPLNTRLISVKTPEGEWKSYNLQGAIDVDAAFLKLIADSYNNIWILQPRDNKIVVYNHNGTPLDVLDDPAPRVKVLTSGEGAGDLPGDEVLSIAEDKNGEVWVGTNEGVAVFFNPSQIFNSSNIDAQQIFIQQDGTTQILFENEAITAIAIDGANRKWIGTRNAGVFLMSADGTEQILHFTRSNSPLYSDEINAIAIDDESGEVFIGTDKGIISYRGTATEPKDKISDVFVYPNPVQRDYQGVIAIKGLTERAIVKITDAQGVLVNEMESLGGQAIWDGKNFDGARVSTGVYLIFSASANGEESNVAKVMVLN